MLARLLCSLLTPTYYILCLAGFLPITYCLDSPQTSVPLPNRLSVSHPQLFQMTSVLIAVCRARIKHWQPYIFAKSWPLVEFHLQGFIPEILGTQSSEFKLCRESSGEIV